MQVELFLAGLAGMTFVAFIIYALTSKKRTEKALDDSESPKSALAKDGPTGDVEDRT
ncbi:MAG: hypothetical protein AAF390_02550 [Pseudomonadota bacterium]